MAMNPEIKAQWVAALRSGEYEQCREALRSRDGFCCLGVLCDLYSNAHNAEWNDRELRRGDDEMPSARVYEWAGLPSAAMVEIDARRGSLTYHNDISGRSFAEIAAAIEAQL